MQNDRIDRMREPDWSARPVNIVLDDFDHADPHVDGGTMTKISASGTATNGLAMSRHHPGYGPEPADAHHEPDEKQQQQQC